jgi:hypothetical protein
LIDFKASKNEDYLHSGEQQLIDFIQEQITYAGQNFKSYPHSKADIEKFNQFFIHQLNR